MWHELGELIVKDKYYAQSLRKDGFVSIVNNIARKSGQEALGIKSNNENEFECTDEGFVFASS